MSVCLHRNVCLYSQRPTRYSDEKHVNCSEPDRRWINERWNCTVSMSEMFWGSSCVRVFAMHLITWVIMMIDILTRCLCLCVCFFAGDGLPETIAVCICCSTMSLAVSCFHIYGTLAVLVPLPVSKYLRHRPGFKRQKWAFYIFIKHNFNAQKKLVQLC